ncbi:HAD-IA family hydrolase [Pseudonocardia sp.]|uniref:HAD-IA family hydrolase n=1 Tax=Pseudonocardia sp. TaxID=60912 RepID=UPI003D14AAFC
MPRALLLDLGGTAIGSGVEAMADLAEREPALREVCARRGPLGPVADPEWDEMITGGITEREYWHRRGAEFGAALGRPGWTVQEFMHLLFGQPGLRPGARRLAADARAAGVPVGVLTNDLRAFHGEDAVSEHPFLAEFDVLVDGSDIGVLKPDPRAYAIAARRLGLPPGEIVFVDDMPGNVDGARRAGMVAVLLDYADPDAAFDTARAALGLGRRAA